VEVLRGIKTTLCFRHSR